MGDVLCVAVYSLLKLHDIFVSSIKVRSQSKTYKLCVGQFTIFFSKMSGSDTTDSDQGIRYKTENTRQKDVPPSRYALPKDDFVRNNKKFSSQKHSRKKLKRDESDSSSDDEYHKRNYNSRRKQKHERRKSNDIVNKSENRCKSSKSPSSTSVSFGPVLPPHLKQKSDSTNSEIQNVPLGPSLPPHLTRTAEPPTKSHSKIQDETFGPNLPSNTKCEEAKSIKDQNLSVVGSPVTIGPILPSHLQKSISEEQEKEKSSDECSVIPSAIGPGLPPHLIKNDQKDDLPESGLSQETTGPPIIGPAIPSQLRQKLLDDTSSYDVFQEEEENDMYGPMPEGINLTKAHLELEERALQMRINQLEPSKDKEPIREEWMLELPAVKRAAFGLGPRNFKMKAGPDLSDRSSWTDTPQDKAKNKTEPKIDLKEEARLQELQKRDKEQDEIIKKHKKRKESLLDLHTKKMKTNSKDKDGPSERRPFSRDVDLQVNRFDEAQKKAVLKKAQLLDNRFSAGEAKFL